MPMQTISTFQTIKQQARTVLMALFSVGFLPNKNLQATALNPASWQSDELSVTYSSQLWQRI